MSFQDLFFVDTDLFHLDVGTKKPPTITYGMNPKTFHPVAGNMYWRKSPRNHGNRSSKNNEVIELTDSEDDSVRIVQVRSCIFLNASSCIHSLCLD